MNDDDSGTPGHVHEFSVDSACACGISISALVRRLAAEHRAMRDLLARVMATHDDDSGFLAEWRAIDPTQGEDTMTTDDEHAEPFGADVEQIRRRCLGRTIVDIIAEEESGQKWRDGTIKQTTWWIWVGLVLDDGTRIRADGGEDAGGGYGFLEIERGKGAG